MPFTTNKLLSVQAAGTNTGTWGAGTTDSLNEGVIEKLDVMLGGITTLSLTSSNVAMTQAQCNNALIRLTGTLLANITIAPDAGVTQIGFFMFENVTAGAFTVTYSNGISTLVLPQGRRGIFWNDQTNGPRLISICGVTGADATPTGTSMMFYQASVPTGWTAVVTNDVAFRAVLNGTSGGTSGGTLAFSTVFGGTTTGATTLTVDQIPSHSHSYTSVTLTSSVASGSNTAATVAAASTTGLTGGGNSHTHPMDLRVGYLNVVVGTRV